MKLAHRKKQRACHTFKAIFQMLLLILTVGNLKPDFLPYMEFLIFLRTAKDRI
jgi:hypothetical protein